MVTEKSWILILLFLSSLLGAQAETLVVDQSGSGEYSTIRKAVEAAKPGDEILVHAGCYEEGTIPIRQPVSISGDPGSATLVGGLVVEAPGVSVSALEIRGSGSDTGIELKSSENTIQGCAIRNFSTGVLFGSFNNQLLGSVIEGCSVGVRLRNGSWGSVRETEISSNLGAEVVESPGSVISSCTILGDSGVSISNSSGCAVNGTDFVTRRGIEITNSDGNAVGGNNLSSTEVGIVIQGSKDSTVHHNAVSGSEIAGLILLGSENGSVVNNSVLGCNIGIRLNDFVNGLVGRNRLEENELAGILLEGSQNNEISGNLLLGNGEGLTLKSASVENSIEENQILQNGLGLSILGSASNLLRGNRLDQNRRAIRIDGEDPSYPDDGPFRQDADSSNTIDEKPFCYMIDGRDLSVSGGCGFLALVGCNDVTANDFVLSNNSAGALVVNSTSCAVQNLTLFGDEVGVRMLLTRDCRVEESRAENCTVGFSVQLGRGDHLFGCAARGSSQAGFEVRDSVATTVKGANASEGQGGIYLSNSSFCTILQSLVRDNQEDGIRLTRSQDCLLNMNRAADNRRGISASGSDRAMVIRNELTGNEDGGLVLDQFSEGTVAGNLASENGDGIFLQSASGVYVEGNNLTRNSRYGFRISFSRDGRIVGNSFIQNGLGGVSLIDCSGWRAYHNNFVHNGNPMLPQNAVDNGDNEWDAGPEVGGNYWSDHQVEGNPGSYPRSIPTRGTDRYPFSDPDGWK